MHPLTRAFHDQAAACADLGSPFMARLCTHLAGTLRRDTPLGHRLFDWPGDLTPRGASVPLRLCGALHALRLMGRADLAAVYPPHTPADAAFAAAIDAALLSDATFVDAFIDSPPQTNEVRRAATLIAAAHWLYARHRLPMRVCELGASAGLNLMFDRYALDIGGTVLGPADPALVLAPDWTGDMPPDAAPPIAERRGVDLNPLDPRDADDVLRLRAYLWPDQPPRRALTDAAITAATAPVDRADAAAWLPAHLAPRPGHLHLIYTTIAWQYFPADTQASLTAAIAAAGARATPDTPLALFRMEADETGPGAALTLRLWPGGHDVTMGRADFHGRWVRWTAPA